MIHPKRDALIALTLTLLGLAGFGFGLWRTLRMGDQDVPGGVGIAIGGLVAFLSFLMLLNFLWALRLVRRIQRGEGLVARWHVPAATIDAYRAAEAARPWGERSRWKPRKATTAEVIFSQDAVVAGGAYHGLASAGVQRMVAVQTLPGNPMTLEFSSRELTSLPSGTLTTTPTVLRLPIARGAEDAAARVLQHFSKVLAGELLVLPDFWAKRMRWAKAALVLALLIGAAGWGLAIYADWRADDPLGLTAMILMILGAVVGLAAVVLMLVASRYHRMQRGQK